jgi:hypothetical protein
MRRGQLEQGVTIDVARSDIAARIRPVCAHFAEADFAALVDRMAEIEVRYNLRDDWMFYREQFTAESSRELGRI